MDNSPKSFTFLRSFSYEFSNIEMGFTVRNSTIEIKKREILL